MANFARFDQDVNVSLESKFFPKIEKSQETALTIYRDSEDGIIFFFSVWPSINEYELAHEFYEAQLHTEPKCPYRRKGYRCMYRLPYRPLCNSLGWEDAIQLYM